MWLVGAPSARADVPALLRVAHLSGDTPAVDVAVTPLGGGPVLVGLPSLRYGDLSDFRRLPPGRYAVSVRAAGAASSVPPVLTVAVDLVPGTARTVAVGGRFADLRLVTLPEDIGAPPPGSARVQVLDGATTAPSVDLSVTGGPLLASGLHAPAAAPGATVPAGPHQLRLTAGGTTTQLPLDVPAGAVLTLLVLDSPGGGLTVRPVVDAAGPTSTPVGAVDAGEGGTAATTPASVLACLAGAALAAGLAARRRRLRPAVLACLAGAAALAAWSPAPPTVALPAARVEPSPAAAAAATPVRLLVPTVGIDAPLVPITPDASGALTAPAATGTAGWLSTGPAPGATGPAVVAGHVDSRRGPAVFFRLRRLAPGDAVLVRRSDGTTARFVVDRVARYPKSAFPTAEVYGPTPDAQLRLITCGGAFDRGAGSYRDDVVVFARAT